MWTRPVFDRNTVFLNKFFLLTLAVLVSIIVSYFFLDRPIALYLQNSPGWLAAYGKGASSVINPSFHVFLWIFVFYSLRFIYRIGIWGNKALFFALAIVVTNVSIGPMKVFLGRMRPELFLKSQLYGFDFFSFHYADLSFPSGHAATIGALAGAFACFHMRKSWYYAGGALLLALSRVILEKHYLSDVIGGVYMGLVMSQTVYLTMKLETRRS